MEYVSNSDSESSSPCSSIDHDDSSLDEGFSNAENIQSHYFILNGNYKNFKQNIYVVSFLFL